MSKNTPILIGGGVLALGALYLWAAKSQREQTGTRQPGAKERGVSVGALPDFVGHGGGGFADADSGGLSQIATSPGDSFVGPNILAKTETKTVNTTWRRKLPVGIGINASNASGKHAPNIVTKNASSGIGAPSAGQVLSHTGTRKIGASAQAKQTGATAPVLFVPGDKGDVDLIAAPTPFQPVMKVYVPSIGPAKKAASKTITKHQISANMMGISGRVRNWH